MISVNSNQVLFFRSKNCVGPYTSYSLGDSVVISPSDSEYRKYQSCMIGTEVWVNVWQNNDLNDVKSPHQELKSGIHNDLSILDGISKFQVIENGFGYSIDIKLICESNRSPIASGFKLTLIPYQSKSMTCKSGDDYVQFSIPTLNPPDSDIVCQVSVAKTIWPSQIVANGGSISFKYDTITGIISYKTMGFPNNLTINQDGKTEFTFTIKSVHIN